MYRNYSPLKVVNILILLVGCFQLRAENFTAKNEYFKKDLENIWISGEKADYNAVPALIQLLKDSNYTIRQAAAAALGKIKDRRAIDPLIDCIIDDSSKIQNTAAIALGRFGKPAVVSLVYRYKNLFKGFNPEINLLSAISIATLKPYVFYIIISLKTADSLCYKYDML